MIKKTLVGGSLALLLSGLVFGTGMSSYMKTGFGYARDAVKDVVPVNVEIDRARQMIDDLQPEIAKNMKLIASEKIHVAKLQKQIDSKADMLASAERDIMRLTADLQSGDTRFVYAKRTYSADQVKDDLSGRFNRFKTQKATVDKLQQMLTAREKTLQAAKDRMDEMLSAKRQLEVEVENLQAQYAANQVAHAASSLNLDDSHLSRTRDLIDSIRTRIEVDEELLAVDNQYYGTIELTEESDEDILNQVSTYFNGDQPTAEDSVAMIQID
ncbi:hypothetical protein EC9_54830 [Rosistilla ulvae]|uniref:Chromosome partition protein Smc n=1 Tax=Rosistilla ulvae TaxID=1930277 RepID=A0A517M8R3_9BACT|nr:hypothetical protein [Rosistilla ulvae]QDS91259.1 hypothetical protein EC9_54830 [Rosistilla ulvae]